MTESCATLGGSVERGGGGGGGVARAVVTNGRVTEKELRSRTGEPTFNGPFKASKDVIEFD